VEPLLRKDLLNVSDAQQDPCPLNPQVIVPIVLPELMNSTVLAINVLRGPLLIQDLLNVPLVKQDTYPRKIQAFVLLVLEGLMQ